MHWGFWSARPPCVHRITAPNWVSSKNKAPHANERNEITPPIHTGAPRQATTQESVWSDSHLTMYPTPVLSEDSGENSLRNLGGRGVYAKSVPFTDGTYEIEGRSPRGSDVELEFSPMEEMKNARPSDSSRE